MPPAPAPRTAPAQDVNVDEIKSCLMKELSTTRANVDAVITTLAEAYGAVVAMHADAYTGKGYDPAQMLLLGRTVFLIH